MKCYVITLFDHNGSWHGVHSVHLDPMKAREVAAGLDREKYSVIISHAETHLGPWILIPKGTSSDCLNYESKQQARLAGND